MYFRIIQKRKFWYAVSLILFIASIALVFIWTPKFSIDFTGGTLLEIKFSENRLPDSDISNKLAELNLGNIQVQESGDKNVLLKTKFLSNDEHTAILTKLNEMTPVEELSYEAIGPTIGKELARKSIWALSIVILAIIIYIAIAFRKVSYPVTSWKYGVAAILAVVHDLLVTIGIFVILGKFLGFEINTPFVAALLTILGYSVNDTIVVFDRVRENLHKYEGEFEEIVEKSIWETMARSINTIVTVELALLALLIFGGSAIYDFILPLFIGIFFGAYSSIFIASQILVAWQKLEWKMKKTQ